MFNTVINDVINSVIVCVPAYISLIMLQSDAVRWRMQKVLLKNTIEVNNRFEIPLTLVLSMISVAMKQGSSLTYSLRVVGQILGTDFGKQMCRACAVLEKGGGWNEAWVPLQSRYSDARAIGILRETLEPTWKSGVSALGRLEIAIERLNAEEEADITQQSSRLSVQLLLPMGLCFLPAFIVVAVIPSIVSFIS